MIPYVAHPVVQVGPVAVSAFHALLLLAVVVGLEIVVRRAPRHGIVRAQAARLFAGMIFCGLVGSHWFAVLAYEPQRLFEDPTELLRVWGSMSSIGGILGGLAGGWWWLRRRGDDTDLTLRLVEGISYATPFAWAVGRLGCALAHDHLGTPSSHWLAVRFPEGPRWDVGLLEFLYLCGIAASFAALGRRPRPIGFFFGLFLVLYCPARVLFEPLRVDETYYLGRTPAQYVCSVGTFIGLFVLTRLCFQRTGSTTRSPSRP